MMKLTSLMITMALSWPWVVSFAMDRSEPPLSDANLQRKLCRLNLTWHQNKQGLPFGAQTEAEKNPFNLQKINEPTEEHMTPLVWALNNSQTDDKAFLTYLIDHGADINNHQIVCSALNWARFGIIPWLVEKGAPISELKAAFGIKSIFMAIIYPLHSNLKLIEQGHGQGPDKKQEMNQMVEDCLNVIKLLHAKGFPLDKHGYYMRTPLMDAADFGLVPLTEFFLKHEAGLTLRRSKKKPEVSIVDILKKTANENPLIIADRPKCIQLIEEHVRKAQQEAQPGPSLGQRVGNLLGIS